MTTEAPPQYTITVETPVDDNGQQELSGWRTVVKDGSDVAYDSQLAHGRAGIFPSDKTATRHGERWVAAKAELAATVAQVKREREAELPRLLEQSLDREAELKAEKTEISGQIKAQSKLRARLISEALHPVVRMSFRPGGADFAVTVETLDEAGNEPEPGEEPEAKPTKGKRRAPPKPGEALPDIRDMVAGKRPAGIQVDDELIAAVAKASEADLSWVTDKWAETWPSLARAILWAEELRAGAPRPAIVDDLRVLLHARSLDPAEPMNADKWGALLLCHPRGGYPPTEHVEAGIQHVTAIEVVRYVQGIELARKKSARAVVVQLCEERLGELLEAGAS